jgi:dolichyl-diphosphooligosaccharide--protein glycosyltransferase
MAYAYPPPGLSPAATSNALSLLRIVTLATIAAAAVASRLFAVVRFESCVSSPSNNAAVLDPS